MQDTPIICMADANMKILWISHGIYVDSAIGEPIVDFVKDSFVRELAAAIGEALMTGSSQVVYYEMVDDTSWMSTIFRSSVPGVSVIFQSLEIPCLPEEFSIREVEVMQRLHRGMRPAMIQRELGISASTFADHQRNAMKKAKANSPSELAVLASKMRLQAYYSRFLLDRI